MKKISVLMNYLLILFLILFLAVNCKNPDNSKKRELDLAEKELELREKEIALKEKELSQTQFNNALNDSKLSTQEAVRIAENMFSNYLPKILRSNGGVLQQKQVFTGDFTKDNIEDILIDFVLSPEDGGNSVLTHGLVLYQNTGYEVKIIAGYQPDNTIFAFNKISNGNIFIDYLSYKESDPLCCPSMSITRALTIEGSNVY